MTGDRKVLGDKWVNAVDHSDAAQSATNLNERTKIDVLIANCEDCKDFTIFASRGGIEGIQGILATVKLLEMLQNGVSQKEFIIIMDYWLYFLTIVSLGKFHHQLFLSRIRNFPQQFRNFAIVRKGWRKGRSI